MKKYIFIAALFISSFCFGQTVTVNRGWTKMISSSDITDAGNDYNTSYLSSSSQSRVTIKTKKRTRNNYYVLSVHRVDDQWHPDLNLQIKTNQGGSAFQTLSDYFYTDIFDSTGTKRINIQYKITGLSVLLPAASYSTEIVFTLWDY